MSGPSAGYYDPVQASIRRQSRTQAGGEPVHGTPTEVCKRYIRFPRNIIGREQLLQGQTTSSTQLYIRVRRDSVTDTILPDDEIWHRGRVYGILAIMGLDYALDELEFQCQVLNR